MTMLLGSQMGHYPFPSQFTGIGHYPFPSQFTGPTLLGLGQDQPRVNWGALWPKIAGTLALASAAASGYHGYKRNESIGWALAWFGLGILFPVVTPVIAVAQGFGKKK